MNNNLLFTMLTVYALSCIIIFLIPERLFPKGHTEERIVTSRGFYRKVFVISGAIIILIVLLVDYFTA